MSGATTDRKALNECITYLRQMNSKQVKITHLVVTEASRLSRPDDI